MKSPQAPTTSTETGPEPKRRKTYTIRKQREMWTEEEHQKFLEGLRLFDRDWRCIEEYIGTKTAAQIRSHAQKYFEKNQSASIPPAKHKRKQDRRSAGPLIIPWITAPDALSDKPYLADPTAFANWMQANGFLANQPPPGISPIQLAEMERQQSEQLKLALTQIQSAMTEANSIQSSNARDPAEAGGAPNKPNWSQIYSYLGTLFDTTPTPQAPRLAEMRAADRIVVQLLMHNLTLTVSSDDNEEYKELLQEYQDQIKGVQRQQQEDQRRRNLPSQVGQSQPQQQQQPLVYMQQSHLLQQQQSFVQLQPQQQHQSPPQQHPLGQLRPNSQEQQHRLAYMQQQQWQALAQMQQAQLQQTQQRPLPYIPQPSFTNEAGMPVPQPRRSKRRSSHRRASQDSMEALDVSESLADLMSSLSESTPAASDLPSEPEFLQTSPIPMSGLTNSQTPPQVVIPRFPNEGPRFSQPPPVTLPPLGNLALPDGVQRVLSSNQSQGTPVGVPLILQPSLVPSIPTPLTRPTAVNQDSPFKPSSQTDSTTQ